MNAVISKSFLPFLHDKVSVVSRPSDPPPIFALAHQKQAGYEQIKTGWPLPGWRTAPVNSKVNAKLMSLILHALDQDHGKGIHDDNRAEHRRATVERYVVTGKRHAFAGTTLQPEEVRLLGQLYQDKCCAPGPDFFSGTGSEVRQRVLDELKRDPVGAHLAAGQFGVAERSLKTAIKTLQKSKEVDISSIVKREHGRSDRLITDAAIDRLQARSESARSALIGAESRELIREIRSYANYAL